MKRAAILLACMFLAFPSTAEAKRLYDNDGRTIETSQRSAQQRHARNDRIIRKGTAGRAGVRHRTADRPQVDGRQAQIIGGRPSGCPRKYCGCATAIKLFGRNRPELYLAANWLRKFPRAVAAPGMAAAREGHVMLLMEPAGGDKWKVWDANSGKGLTRIHIRSIRGFVTVNPHATRVANKNTGAI
jgi:hypothetical protein